MPGFVTSAALLTLLALFFGANFHNVVTGVRARRGKDSGEEVPRPGDMWTALAGIGIISFFVEATAYGVLGLLGGEDPVQTVLVPIPGLFDVLSVLGLALVAAGVLVFLWSVAARGRYSVSWEMPLDQRLVTWGPYRYVRYPSYSGYFMMFLGLALMINNPAILVPILAVAGYAGLVDDEKRLLVARFDDEYRRYAEATGRFTPRLRRSR
ncbi:MAG TPA: isoprenylcysteine carboxylmethyltransferase family protein [Candidatus Bathyarchaeia archaeon]